MANTTHCTLTPSPSRLEMTARCPGWWRQYQGMSNSYKQAIEAAPSKDAELGTEIHECYQTATNIFIENGCSVDRIDDTVDTLDYIYYGTKWYDYDLRENIKNYLQHIDAAIYDATGGLLDYNIATEAKSDCGQYIHGLYGYTDCIITTADTITVIDIKTGHAVIEPENNRQLACYAAGFITEQTKTVNLIIWQNGDWKQASYPVESVKNLMQDNVKVIRESLKMNAEKKAGTHCKYCPCKAICPAFKATASDGAKVATVFNNNKNSMSIEAIENTYEALKVISNLTTKALEDAAAILKANPTKLQNYTIKERKGGRYIKDYKALAGYLQTQGYNVTEDDFKKTEPMTITDIIRIYGTATIEAAPDDIVGRKDGTVTIQKAKDKDGNKGGE